MTRRLTAAERLALSVHDFRKRQPQCLRDAFANGAPPVVYRETVDDPDHGKEPT